MLTCAGKPFPNKNVIIIIIFFIIYLPKALEHI